MKKAALEIEVKIEDVVNHAKTAAYDSVFATDPERRAELEQETRMLQAESRGLQTALALVNYHCKCES